MPSRLFQKNIVRIAIILFFALFSLIGTVFYDKITYQLEPAPDLITYVHQNYTDSNIINHIELKGITLIGIMVNEGKYEILGFIKSPISSHYKKKVLVYDAENYSNKGLICMLTSKVFTYDFILYEATNDNIEKSNMQNPYYFIFLGVQDEKYILDYANSVHQTASGYILKAQLTPYIVICSLSMIISIIVCSILKKCFLRTNTA